MAKRRSDGFAASASATYLGDLSFTVSHNSFTDSLQFLTPASVESIIKNLEHGYRGIELDIWPGEGEAGVQVTHHPSFQKGVPVEECLAAIATYMTTSATMLPLFIFFDEKVRDVHSEKRLTLLAEWCHTLFGRLVHRPTKSLFFTTLKEVYGKVVFISTTRNTASVPFNTLLSAGMYDQDEAIEGSPKEMVETHLLTARYSNRLTRVYPKSLLFSSNDGVMDMIGKANFVAVNSKTPFKKRRDNWSTAVVASTYHSNEIGG